MNRPHTLAGLCLGAAVALTLPAFAQDEAAHAMTPEQQAEMDAYIKAGTPGPEHAAMAASTGSYALAIKSWHAPGTEPMLEAGTATRRMILGGRVMVEEMTATMMGQSFTGYGMRGYDNVTGKHWSTWNDSMSTGVMLSTGSCDADHACTFTGSWTDPVKKTLVNSRMTTRPGKSGSEIFEMYGDGPDGKEFKMMEMTYTPQR